MVRINAIDCQGGSFDVRAFEGFNMMAMCFPANEFT